MCIWTILEYICIRWCYIYFPGFESKDPEIINVRACVCVCVYMFSFSEDEDETHHPTKKNIEKALEWLVKDCGKGESLVFYFSGHGLRQPDFNDDEIDGFDETICPVDFKKEGMILDNYINTTIVKPLREGVTLHAIVDACHSGTILDLVYIYNRNT